MDTPTTSGRAGAAFDRLRTNVHTLNMSPRLAVLAAVALLAAPEEAFDLVLTTVDDVAALLADARELVGDIARVFDPLNTDAVEAARVERVAFETTVAAFNGWD